jgi:hypothetical protein
MGEETNAETGERQQERLPDGQPYENTDAKWVYIQEAAKYARNMRLVSPWNLIDQRASRKAFNAPSEPPEVPSATVYPPEIRLTSLQGKSLQAEVDNAVSMADGYSYDVGRVQIGETRGAWGPRWRKRPQVILVPVLAVGLGPYDLLRVAQFDLERMYRHRAPDEQRGE